MAIRQKTTYYSDEGFEFTFEPIEDSLTIEKTPTGYTAKYLTNDDLPESPREDDNLGTIIAFTDRFDLADKKNPFSSLEEAEEWLIEHRKELVILSLIFQDYGSGGIRLYTRPFEEKEESRWLVGWVYAKKGVEGLTTSRIEANLKGEIETFEKYLNGDVYGTVVETYDHNKNSLAREDVWGYFGYKDALEQLKEM